MSLSTLLPLASTIMAAVFAVSLLRRYARRKGKHLLIWGIAMIMYGLGTFAEFYLSLAWSPTIFRLWYLCGAMLVAAWLGQGTIHLLVRRPHVADILLAVLTITSVIAAIHLFATPLNESIFNASLPVSQQYATNSAKGIVGLMPEGGVRSYSFLFNIYGTVALVGGALYSAYIFWRKRILPQRVLGNVLIAFGGLSPALGGTLARIGATEFLYASELIGVVVIYIGFRLATAQIPAPAQSSPSTAAPAT